MLAPFFGKLFSLISPSKAVADVTLEKAFQMFWF